MNKKIIVTTSAIAAMAVNVMANNIVTGPVEPNTTAPVATGYNSIASGANTVVNATNSVALGRDNKITGDDTIVIGGGNGTVAGGQSTAIGYNNYIGAHQEQTVIGANSVVDNQGSIVIGTHSITRGIDAVTIGNNASAPIQNSVAIGTNSQTYNAVPFGQMQINGVTHIFAGEKPNSTVSFGSKKSDTYSNLDNYSRQLQNVAAGRIEADSLDAVNGSQLFAAIAEIETNAKQIAKNKQNIKDVAVGLNMLGDVVNDHEQAIAGNTTAIANNTARINGNTSAINSLGQKVTANTADIRALEHVADNHEGRIASLENRSLGLANDINNKVNNLGQRVNRLGASSAALAGLHPLEYNKDDKGNFAISYGHYRNANAIALGAFYSPNEKVRLGFGITLGGETQFNINAAFRTGRGSEYEPQAKNGELEQLRQEVEMLKELINK